MSIVWFILGIVFGVFCWEIFRRLKGSEVPAKKVLWMIAWIMFIFFCVMFVITSIGEGEPRAGGIGAIVFGGLAVVGSMGIRKELAELFRSR